MKIACILLAFHLMFPIATKPLIAFNMPKTPIICVQQTIDKPAGINVNWNPTIRVCSITNE